MQKTVLSGALLAAVTAGAMPVISADSVRMTVEANRVVAIDYTLAGEDAVVTLDIETRGAGGAWRSIGVPLAHAVGDCWRKVAPGAHRIFWSARQDWPNHFADDSTVRAVVTAWATNCPPDYMVLDLNTFTQTFYPSADYLPLGLTNAIYRTTRLVMRKIPAAGATFVMGQTTNNTTDIACRNCFRPVDARAHLVTLTNDFYMAIYETTQRQQVKLRLGGASGAGYDIGDDLPVGAVSYQTLRGKVSDGIDWPNSGTAVSGSSVLNEFRTNTGILFDLPTEAEWEFACRAGTDTAYYNGEEYCNSSVGCTRIADLGWTKANRPEEDRIQSKDNAKYGGLRVVGQKAPNAWGLYDLYGNASEWCKDYAAAYDDSVQPAIAPTGPATGTARIKRGGNWYEEGVWCSSNARSSTAHVDWSLDPTGGNSDASAYRTWSNGYRLVCPAVAK